jgi:hypothetical protein
MNPSLPHSGASARFMFPIPPFLSLLDDDVNVIVRATLVCLLNYSLVQVNHSDPCFQTFFMSLQKGFQFVGLTPQYQIDGI